MIIGILMDGGMGILEVMNNLLLFYWIFDIFFNWSENELVLRFVNKC